MNSSRLICLLLRSLSLSSTFLSITSPPSAAQLSSDFGFLHIDPLDNFEELRIEPIEPISRTFEECLANPEAIFVIRTRGGLADDPTQTLRERTLWQDLRPLDNWPTLEPTRHESATVNSDTSQLEDDDGFDRPDCRAWFDHP